MDIKILLQRFCDHASYIKGHSKPTIKRYRTSLGYYLKVSGVQTIEEVNDRNVREFFVHGRAVKKWTPNTFITYHKSLLVFFRWCVETGHLGKNHVEEIETPRPLKELPKRISKAEAGKLLDVVLNYPWPNDFLRYRNHAIFTMFIHAGLRKSELLNLRLVDVDIDNLTIFVSMGKGAKDRIIPMSHTLAQTLKRYLVERRRLKKTCPQFFVSLNRDQGYTDSGLRREVRKMKGASGVSFTIHRLRHTFATLMVEGGCDIYSLSRMMGHSDIKTTTIYLSATAEHLRGQILKHPMNQ